MAEQAGMAQLLWGQHAWCQAREHTRGTACHWWGRRMHAVAGWQTGNILDPAVLRPQAAVLMTRLGTNLPSQPRPGGAGWGPA